jgi:hypothetical protein
MHRMLRHLAIAALLTGSISGCSDFLSGPTIDQDPNNPSLSTSTDAQIYGGFQATQFANFGSTLAVSICGWMQQCLGTNSRFVENQLVDYIIDPSTFDVDFIQAYGTGGLNDLRVLRGRLQEKGDQVWVGITKIWEALIMSEAADKWGDIPFSTAATVDIENPTVDFPAPTLDNQLAVYDALQTLLDEGIADVNSAVGPGPGIADFNFQGDPAAWTAVAHTLKARIQLHRVRADCGATLAGCPNYTQIVTETALGIQQGGRDLTTVVAGTGGLESNTWFTFYAFSGFGDDLRAGEFLVNLMSTRNAGGPDPRFNIYFANPVEVGKAVDDGLGFFIKVSNNVTSPANRPQPWVTQDENTLMRAEALLESGNPGGALAELNVIRAKYGLPALGAFGPDPLADIIEEKYVTMFQNWEIWNDYKRTCIPDLVPTSDLGPIAELIPRRLYYGQSEDDANDNIPNASEQGSGGSGGTQLDGTPVNLPEFRNRNDPPPPVGCTPLEFPVGP